jgi:hypothetical protein
MIAATQAETYYLHLSRKKVVSPPLSTLASRYAKVIYHMIFMHNDAFRSLEIEMVATWTVSAPLLPAELLLQQCQHTLQVRLFLHPIKNA